MTDPKIAMIAGFNRFLDQNPDCVIEDERALLLAFLAGVQYGCDVTRGILHPIEQEARI